MHYIETLDPRQGKTDPSSIMRENPSAKPTLRLASCDMKTYPFISILTIALITVLGLALQAANTENESTSTQEDAPSQWQHLALPHPADGGFNSEGLAARINQFGRDGWELVSVANFEQDGTTRQTVYYFKKPL